jgi:hypothetical protein
MVDVEPVFQDLDSMFCIHIQIHGNGIDREEFGVFWYILFGKVECSSQIRFYVLGMYVGSRLLTIVLASNLPIWRRSLAHC